MADNHGSESSQTSTDPEAQRLAILRRVAQEHLREIGQQEVKERVEEQEVQAVLDDETRRRLKGDFSRNQTREASEEKGAKMRTAQDVLDRIRWDPSLKIEEFVVGYLDRFGGNKELRASMWLNEVTEEDWVPQHRIRYFKRVAGDTEEVVWHRFDRVDKIFGSTGQKIDGD